MTIEIELVSFASKIGDVPQFGQCLPDGVNPSNPTKPSISYGFPMVFRWSATISGPAAAAGCPTHILSSILGQQPASFGVQTSSKYSIQYTNIMILIYIISNAYISYIYIYIHSYVYIYIYIVVCNIIDIIYITSLISYTVISLISYNMVVSWLIIEHLRITMIPLYGKPQKQIHLNLSFLSPSSVTCPSN